MVNEDKLNIDDLLNQQIQNHESMDFPAYDFIKSKLESEDSSSISFDDFLQQKLDVIDEVKDNKWKKFIFLFWFRKIKKPAVVLFMLAIIGFGINSMFNLKHTNDTTTVKKEVISKHSSEKNRDAESVLPNTNKYDVAEQNYKKNNGINFQKKTVNTKSKNKGSNQTVTSGKMVNENQYKSNDNMAKEFNLDEYILGSNFMQNLIKLNTKPLIVEIEQLAISKIKKEFKQKSTLFTALPSGNFLIGLSFLASHQKYQSEVQEKNDKKLNRNYSEISSNGNKKSIVFNYGISMERTFYKGFGASIGINKMTLLKSQHVDYELKEVPVIDINGEIAGYIQISPERIQEKVTSKIQYMSFPVLVSYSLQFKEKNSFQFKLGTNILSEISNNNYKYDYTTLQLSSYHNNSKKQSFNNIQYGMFYNRYITNKFILGLGYERQNLGKVNSLSDKTELVKSTINNIGISFKIQL